MSAALHFLQLWLLYPLSLLSSVGLIWAGVRSWGKWSSAFAVLIGLIWTAFLGFVIISAAGSGLRERLTGELPQSGAQRFVEIGRGDIKPSELFRVALDQPGINLDERLAAAARSEWRMASQAEPMRVRETRSSAAGNRERGMPAAPTVRATIPAAASAASSTGIAIAADRRPAPLIAGNSPPTGPTRTCRPDRPMPDRA